MIEEIIKKLPPEAKLAGTTRTQVNADGLLEHPDQTGF